LRRPRRPGRPSRSRRTENNAKAARPDSARFRDPLEKQPESRGKSFYARQFSHPEIKVLKPGEGGGFRDEGPASVDSAKMPRNPRSPANHEGSDPAWRWFLPVCYATPNLVATLYRNPGGDTLHRD